VRQPLKHLFCGRFNCPPDQFEEQAFRQCLPFHARLLAPLIQKFSPGFFADDLELIKYLGEATNWREARTEVATFQDMVRAKESFLRDGCRLRVSGRLATRLANRLFRDGNESAKTVMS